MPTLAEPVAPITLTVYTALEVSHLCSAVAVHGYSIGIHNCRPGNEAGVKCASKCMIPICTESATYFLENEQSISNLIRDYVAVSFISHFLLHTQLSKQ